jgi:hypothetical protein
VSHFIDEQATEVISIPCMCPGEPHKNDTITVRTELGYGDTMKLRDVLAEGAASRLFLSLVIADWTLLDKDGKARPPTHRNIGLLKPESADLLVQAIEALPAYRPPGPEPEQLPNASGASSPASSSES